MRCGRIRNASRTRCRRLISPVPSRFGCLVCIRTTSGNGTLSSKTSSQVITRSRAGTAAVRQLSMVVLPAWVPPATSTLSPATTQASRKLAAGAVSVPRPTSSSRWFARTMNLRMFTAQCSAVMSGMTTCRRLPSGSIASTNGEERSMRRPEDLSMRSTRSRISAAVKIVVVSSLRPRWATKTLLGSLIQISSTVGSSR